MPATELSTEEIISLLSKTCLPTILIEGSDDVIVYRRFEERLSNLGVSVFPVGGRSKLLEIFERRAELTGTRFAFVADRDTWVHSQVPANYDHPKLVLTHGYSIENDVFTDGDWLNLLTPAERAKFGTELAAFLDWYALALSRHLVDPSVSISLHPDHVLNPAVRPALLALRPSEEFPQNLFAQLTTEFQRLLRGKSLIALLLRHASYPGRQPRHNSGALLQMTAARPGFLLNRLSDLVATAIQSDEVHTGMS